MLCSACLLWIKNQPKLRSWFKIGLHEREREVLALCGAAETQPSDLWVMHAYQMLIFWPATGLLISFPWRRYSEQADTVKQFPLCARWFPSRKHTALCLDCSHLGCVLKSRQALHVSDSPTEKQKSLHLVRGLKAACKMGSWSSDPNEGRWYYTSEGGKSEETICLDRCLIFNLRSPWPEGFLFSLETNKTQTLQSRSLSRKCEWFQNPCVSCTLFPVRGLSPSILILEHDFLFFFKIQLYF